MASIRILKKIDSETLVLPELRLLVGKTVEIQVTEQPESPAPSLPLPPDQWRAELAAWIEDAKKRADRYPPNHVVDDSRDTIYGERDRV